MSAYSDVAQVLEGVTPQVQFVKVVNDELVELMGSAGTKELNEGQPQIILMAGLQVRSSSSSGASVDCPAVSAISQQASAANSVWLLTRVPCQRCVCHTCTLTLTLMCSPVVQGVGKTTACGKLAQFLKKRRRSVLLVATDVYRPAAIDQLVKLGQKIDVPVFELGTGVSPVEIARQGIAKGKEMGVDAVIVDTAGRLQVIETHSLLRPAVVWAVQVPIAVVSAASTHI